MNLRQQRRIQGLCWQCGREKSPDKAQCDLCLEGRKRRNKLQVEKGTCIICRSRQPRPSMRTCQTCEDMRKRWKTRCEEQGLCNTCGQSPVQEGRVTCQSCTAKRIKSRLEANERGNCNLCLKRPKLPKIQHCMMCCLRRNARNNGITKIEDIKALGTKLIEQNFRCPYSGRLLSLGSNASIDHKVPRSKGGGNELSNLHWVDLSVNVIKKNMDEDEFIPFFDVFLKEAYQYRFGD